MLPSMVARLPFTSSLCIYLCLRELSDPVSPYVKCFIYRCHVSSSGWAPSWPTLVIKTQADQRLQHKDPSSRRSTVLFRTNPSALEHPWTDNSKAHTARSKHAGRKGTLGAELTAKSRNGQMLRLSVIGEMEACFPSILLARRLGSFNTAQ